MKASDFKEDILRLRADGESYEAISLWLAKYKGFAVSAGSVRNVVKKNEILEIINKK